MNIKKLLAIAAVALVSVPAYAAASQIVVPGLEEQVVEGHTVFAVIQKVREVEVRKEAAAVAVLVREKEVRESRFNGTLWFNDQFLVAPANSRSVDVRYPCGGAVLAVNHGDPDPREMLLSQNGIDTAQAFFDSPSDPYDVTQQQGDYDTVMAPPNPDGDAQEIPAEGTPTPGPSGADQPGPSSWLDVEDSDALTSTSLNGGSNPVISTATLSSLEYEESYLITDPNDHPWIIDKYNAITIASLDLNAPQLTTTTQKFPVWAVNVLGKPAFTPDDGLASCSPYVDDPWQQAAINYGFYTADGQTCTTTTGAFCPSDPAVDANGDGVPDGADAEPPWLGYYEPTEPDADGDGVNDRESYCYESNSADYGRTPGADDYTNNGRNPPGSDNPCDHGLTWVPPGPGDGVFFRGSVDVADRGINHPLRLYNALLYFYLGPEDVRVTSRAAHGASDTNGCQVGTEWYCPDWTDTDGDGYGDQPGANDDAEGNSHPFNPPGTWAPAVPDGAGGTVPFTGEYYDTQDAFPGRTCSLRYGTNTGGPDQACPDVEHHAHNRGQIDLYFSGTARPLEPAVRFFDTTDTDGRTDPFHAHGPQS